MSDLSLNNAGFKPVELGKLAASSMENTSFTAQVFFSSAYTGCQIECRV